MDDLIFNFPELSKDEDINFLKNFKSDDFEGLDFEQFRSLTYKNLSDLEQQIVDNIVHHDKEFLSMFKTFEETENIINSLKANLNNSQVEINKIYNDIQNLQTNAKNISLKTLNRRQIEEGK
jgi:transcriptional regulator of heat shock response